MKLSYNNKRDRNTADKSEWKRYTQNFSAYVYVHIIYTKHILIYCKMKVYSRL